MRDTLKWADVANVLRIQLERQDLRYFPSLREYAQYFGINKGLLEELNKEVIIMHPGPINRGVELTSDVIDSGHSIILDQVENGVAIRMAVLYLLAPRRDLISIVKFHAKTAPKQLLINSMDLCPDMYDQGFWNHLVWFSPSKIII